MAIVLGSRAYDRIDPCQLLADHQDNGYESALPVSGHEPHLPRQGLEGRIAHQPAFVLELICHFLNLLRNVI